MSKRNRIKIALYGAGQRCRDLLPLLNHETCDVVAIIDLNAQNIGSVIYGYPLYPVEYLERLRDCFFCITIANSPEKIEESYRSIINDSVNFISYYELQYRLIIANDDMMAIFKEMIEERYKLCDYYSFVFSCPNGMVLGGVEHWTIDTILALTNSGLTNCRILTSAINEGQDIPDSVILDRIISHENGLLTEDNVLAIAKYLIEHTPCIVLTSSSDIVMAVAVVLKSLSARIKIISVVHGDVVSNYRNNALFKDTINSYVGFTSSICDNLCKYGIDSTKIQFISCPVNYNHMIFREYNINERLPIRIGWAGRIQVAEKRCDLLIKIIDELINKDILFDLSIAGYGIYYEQLDEYIDSNKLNDRVHLLGMIQKEKMSDFWIKQDIGLMVSDFEGISLSLMEMMANGAVPVSTKVSGARDHILDGINGYIVEVGDYNAVVQRILYLNDNRDLLPAIGQKARQSIEKKCDREKYIESWKGLLFEVVSE